MSTDFCNVCPRNCNIDRNVKNNGYCRTTNDFYISSIVIHKGEEPPISGEKGICNVFFAHCNLQCVYCQNYQISDNKTDADLFKMDFEEVIKKIISILDKGINVLGFVSPSHFPEQMIIIINELHKRKHFPTIVYNSNGYDKIETLKKIEKYVDVYLPDLKYSDVQIAKKYSGASDYPEIAFKAIKEMFRQKGDMFFINKQGYAESGLIIRHLILPNNIPNSLKILDFIANELSRNVHISLMSQYYPTHKAFEYADLSRTITKTEYEEVKQKLKDLNLNNGWIQELQSNKYYRPDFKNKNPFVD